MMTLDERCRHGNRKLRRSDIRPGTNLSPHSKLPRIAPAPLFVTGSGTPVLLLPALGPHHNATSGFSRLLQHLQVARLARHFEVWVLARPIGLPQGCSIQELANRYAASIRFHFNHPVDLIGASTGGSIALQLAIDHPSIVHRLVLISAASTLGERGRTAQRDMTTHLKSGASRRAAAAMLATTTTHRVHRVLLRTAGHALGRLALGENAADLVVLLEAEDRFDVTEQLHRIQAPSLIVGSGHDGYYPTTLFETTASGIPHARLAHFPRRSHLGLTTNPALSDMIAEFLR